jgi:hypothetical protein
VSIHSWSGKLINGMQRITNFCEPPHGTEFSWAVYLVNS